MAAFEAKFNKFWAETKTKSDLTKIPSDGEMKLASEIDRDCVRLPVSGKSLKRQLELRSENSQEVEGLEYGLDSAVAKGRLAQKGY